MSEEISIGTLSKFTKMLVESTGVYDVTDDYSIRSKYDGQIVMTAFGKSTRPIKIRFEDMKIGDYTLLTPFKETAMKDDAREWFYRQLVMAVQGMTSTVIRRIIQLAVNPPQEEKPVLFKLLSICKGATDKTVAEVGSLPATEFINIHYNRGKSSGYMMSPITDDAENVRKTYSKVVSKKTFDLLEELIRGLFEVEPTSTVAERYPYEAYIKDAPETDVKLHLYVNALRLLYPYYSAVVETPMPVDPADLASYLEALPEFVAMEKWVMAGTAHKVVYPKAPEPQAPPPPPQPVAPPQPVQPPPVQQPQPPQAVYQQPVQQPVQMQPQQPQKMNSMGMSVPKNPMAATVPQYAWGYPQQPQPTVSDPRAAMAMGYNPYPGYGQISPQYAMAMRQSYAPQPMPVQPQPYAPVGYGYQPPPMVAPQPSLYAPPPQTMMV